MKSYIICYNYVKNRFRSKESGFGHCIVNVESLDSKFIKNWQEQMENKGFFAVILNIIALEEGKE